MKGGRRPPTCPFVGVAGDCTPPGSPPACSVPTPVSSRAGALGSKGTHAGAGAAHPTPRRAGQGGRGVLYLRPCKKPCRMPLRGFLGPMLGEAVLCRGLRTGPAIQILLPKAAGSPWQGLSLRLTPLWQRVGWVSPSTPAPTHSPTLGGGRVGCCSRAGLTAPGVPTPPSPSAGTTISSWRQRDGKNRFSQGVMTQAGE